MTNPDTIKALRDALTEIEKLCSLGFPHDVIQRRASKGITDAALTADASEDAPDAKLLYVQRAILEAGDHLRTVMAEHPYCDHVQVVKHYADIKYKAMRAARPAPVAATPAPDAEAEEDAALIHKLGKMLAEIAITMKGEEAALHRHSYHDLPELVKVMALELDLYRTIYGPTVPKGWENGAAAPAAPALKYTVQSTEFDYRDPACHHHDWKIVGPDGKTHSTQLSKSVATDYANLLSVTSAAPIASDAEVLARQVAAWRAEVARLQDLIATAEPAASIAEEAAPVNTPESLDAATGSMEDFADAADLVDAITRDSTKGDALGAVLAYRQKLLMKERGQQAGAVDGEAGSSLVEYYRRAAKLVKDAESDGFIITVTATPRRPLSMGNFDLTVDVRESAASYRRAG